jgi:hypothetical protein
MSVGSEAADEVSADVIRRSLRRSEEVSVPPHPGCSVEH